MTSEHTEDMLKHIKIYIFVFAALAVLTGVTVWASYLKVSMTLHIIIAMCIAAVKAGLVVAYFMHLISEKKLIFSILILTAVFFLVLIFIVFFTNRSMAPSVPLFWQVVPKMIHGGH